MQAAFIVINGAANKELYKAFHNWFMEFTQFEAPSTTTKAARNWVQRSCGITSCSLYFGAKIEYAVVETLMELCPLTFRNRFDNDVRRAYAGIPRAVTYLLCKVMTQYIKHTYGLHTWFLPNEDDVCPSDFQEYLDDHALLHMSSVQVEPNHYDECTWVLNAAIYPLEAGDVNANLALDTNPVDPDNYYLKGMDANDNQVIEAAQVWYAYMAEWGRNPLEAP